MFLFGRFDPARVGRPNESSQPASISKLAMTDSDGSRAVALANVPAKQFEWPGLWHTPCGGWLTL